MLRVALIIGFCTKLCSATASNHAHTQSQKQPSPVYQSVSSKVSALEQRLSEIEMENKQKLAARLNKYQAKLQEQQQVNLELATANMAMAKQEQELMKENRELQKRGAELQSDNQLWEEDLQAITSNLSTALEFAGKVVTGIDKDRGDADLEVLTDLRVKDEHAQRVNVHTNQLNEIAMPHVLGQGNRLALLAVKSSPNPRSILKILDAGLEDLQKEYNDNEAALDAQYKELFDTERIKHTELKEEEADLSQRISKSTTLKNRILLAVKHLEESNKDLEKKANSIRMYAQRLGIRTLPRQHVATKSSQVTAHEDDDEGKDVLSHLRKQGARVVEYAEDEDHEQQARQSVHNARKLSSSTDVKRALLSWITG